MSALSAVIVGGGLAGLAAGYALSQAGWTVHLLEAGDEVGGRVRTVRKQGYTLDTGATQMSSGYTEYLGLCKQLGMGDDMVESSSEIGLINGEKLFSIDGRSMLSSLFTPALSWGSKWTIVKTVCDAMAIKPGVDIYDVSRSHAVDVESAEAYTLRRLNREIFDVLVDPLVRAYVMNAADDVSALEWFSAMKNLGGKTMLSLKGGNDRLPKALAQHMQVTTGAAVLGVAKSGGTVAVRCRMPDGVEQTLHADACVLATRLNEAMEIYPVARDIAGEFGAELRYNRAWVVQLGYTRQPEKNLVGVLVSRAAEHRIGLLWCEHAKNPDRVPVGHGLFSVYSDESANDECLAMSDEGLTAVATCFVERLFPELRGAFDMSHVTRWAQAIPNPAPGMYKSMAAMKMRLDASDPVQLAGDYFTCTGQNSAIFYGQAAARTLLAQRLPDPA